MTDTFEVLAESRDDIGKGASRRLRNSAGKVPAIIYGGGEDPRMLMLDANQFNNSLSNEAFYSHILNINVDGKPEKAILKALQRHPHKRQVLHADFLRVTGKEAITMNVPLHFLGEEEAPGVKLEKGIISRHITELEVKCLPKDLPSFIEIDVSAVALDELIHLDAIKLPEGVDLTVDLSVPENNAPVFSIHPPKIEVEPEEEAAAEGEEAAEGAEAEKGSEEKPDDKKD